MKFFIENQEVEIKVKNTAGKCDKNETMALINLICGAFYGGANEERRLGCNAVANRDSKIANQIYSFLENRGYYKDL